ncbi:hypothetical protein BBC0122_020580 [Bartonella choladocola]|uniref:Uncharacterized protein n=1 Tax=Bartonella choladocola TaxID=2750995 RepID=A0A1U9MK95_9HYPH|nr:hypothetical protein BBC0122_020580 [Bartonella choladocola]
MRARNDRAIADAMSYLPKVIEAVSYRLRRRRLAFSTFGRFGLRAIRAAGAKNYLEVLSLDVESEARSVQSPIKFGVDYLLGGTHSDDVLPLIESAGIQYYLLTGRIEGISR